MSDQSLYIQELIKAGFTEQQAATLIRVMYEIRDNRYQFKFDYEEGNPDADL